MSKNNSTNLSHYEHLQNGYELRLREILIRYYGDMKELEVTAELEKYDNLGTNRRMEQIISKTIHDLQGAEYAKDEAITHHTDGADTVLPF